MTRMLTILLAFFPITALAQTADAGVGSQQMAGLLPLVAIAGVMYFLLIRPQQKRMKQHQAMITTLKKGDEVITGGGVYGTVTKVDEKEPFVTIEIASGVQVRVQKMTIGSVVGAEPAQPAPVSKKKTAEKNDNIVPSKNQIANDN